jgi:hypothetical protein
MGVNGRVMFPPLLVLVVCGCGQPGAGGGGGTAGSGADAASADAAGADAARDGPFLGGANAPLGFNPSNAGLMGENASTVGDVVISGTDCDIYAEQGRWDCVDPSRYVHRFATLPSGWKYSVFVMKSLRIDASTIVKTHESAPVIVIAIEDMILLGSIHVLPGTSGGPVNDQARKPGAGPGGGLPGGERGSGGGASFCGIGGAGAVKPGATAGLVLAPYGPPELRPLTGGSSGGTGAFSQGGAGGGAIQLVAGGTFRLAAGAFVSVGGGGGLAGGDSTEMAGGGGSGGALLVEAAVAVVEGALATNGGGGGQGSGAAGEAGRADAIAASGGAQLGDGVVIGRGGDGGAGETIDGNGGVIEGDNNPGGGGGGAGRIRVNTRTGLADVASGTLSPSADTPCVTFGTLG